MAVETIRDLFANEIRHMVDTEERVGRLMGTIAAELPDGEAKRLCQEDRADTPKQIAALQRCLQTLNVSPGKATCHVLAGFEGEHTEFCAGNPSAAPLAVFDLDLAVEVKHYEITAYRLLITKANLLGLEECQRLLQGNQRDEENRAHQLERVDFELTQSLLQILGSQASQRRQAR